VIFIYEADLNEQLEHIEPFVLNARLPPHVLQDGKQLFEALRLLHLVLEPESAAPHVEVARIDVGLLNFVSLRNADFELFRVVLVIVYERRQLIYGLVVFPPHFLYSLE